jgi:serine phosphatase RsbU (regulator of sigma subunit)
MSAHNGQEASSAGEERIALRAYDKWRARCGEGNLQLQDWLEAESELATVADLTHRLVKGEDRLARLLAERRMAERRLVAEHAVGNILAVSETLTAAASKLVRVLCESLDCDAGAVWVVDQNAGLLRCVEVWHGAGVELPVFEPDALQRTFAPGAGLPGRVWATGAVAWIPDLPEESELWGGSIATEEGVHGAIAFPLRNGTEFLGVLELFSRTVRYPTDLLREMMTSIGSQISQFIERRTAEHRLREQAHDRRIGREIQQGLLPRSMPRLPGFEICGRSLAAKDVGGDCFDFIPLTEGARDCLGVFVADASGHGIGAALLTGQTRAYLRALALTCTDIDLLLGLTNQRLTTDVTCDHFVTAFLLSLDSRTRSLRYTSAGHVPGYVLDRQGRTRAVLSSTGIPLGIDPRSDFPASEAITLEPGELVLLLTDGIVEAASLSGELFGPERALKIVRRHQEQAPDEILKALFCVASDYCGKDLRDDLTGVILKCEGAA